MWDYWEIGTEREEEGRKWEGEEGREGEGPLLLRVWTIFEALFLEWLYPSHVFMTQNCS